MGDHLLCSNCSSIRASAWIPRGSALKAAGSALNARLMAGEGSMNQQQLRAIEYLREENHVLREQLGNKQLRLNDDQRRRLAAKAKGLPPVRQMNKMNASAPD
jgi:hypothetical protein